MINVRRPLVSRLVWPLLLAFAASCGSPETGADSAARPVAALVDNRVTGVAAAYLASINGVYGAGCSGRSGAWSLELISGTTALDYPPLAMSRDDVGCLLTITSAKTTKGQLLDAQSSVALDSDYTDEVVAFGDPPMFYASAKLDLSESSDQPPRLLLVYSEDPARATPQPSDVVSYSLPSSNNAVSTPDYGLDASGLVMQTDASDLVLEVGGSAALRPRTVQGVGYAIAKGRLTTYAEIDATYLTAHRPMAVQIPASEFGLLGLTLTPPQVRTLIVANIANGVRSYQAFTQTFGALPK